MTSLSDDPQGRIFESKRAAAIAIAAALSASITILQPCLQKTQKVCMLVICKVMAAVTSKMAR